MAQVSMMAMIQPASAGYDLKCLFFDWQVDGDAVRVGTP